jgi:hypothetical protein
MQSVTETPKMRLIKDKRLENINVRVDENKKILDKQLIDGLLETIEFVLNLDDLDLKL